jgi:TonB-dependent starch-binding outer membrane protein SusC
MYARLTFLIWIVICNPLHAQDAGARVTLRAKGERLENVLNAIQKQTGCFFVYDMAIIKQTEKVTITLQDVSLKDALDSCLKGQPLTYKFFDNIVSIMALKPAPLPPQTWILNGRVSSEKKEPVSGATIRIKGSTRGVFAAEDGTFTLNGIHSGDTLQVSCIGYQSMEVPVKGKMDIIMHPFANTLDETVIIAYGTTTRRLNTGSVDRVTRTEIEQQPIADPLGTIEGRVPGLLITQSSGNPGAYYKVQVRGQNSILQGSDPLIVIDGVPFAPNNNPLNQLTSAANPSGNVNAGGLSPLALISPDDIESIEVLKDADATAIYGSRGAAGVILITTRKGKAGTARFDAHVYSGAGAVTRTLPFMKTGPYLQMRRQAYTNDTVTPNAANAPDLMIWDTNQYTNFTKLLIGGMGNTLDAQASLSVGSEQTQVLLSGSMHDQGSVFPGNLSDLKESFYTSINHHSINRKFSADFVFDLNSDKNTSIAQDLTTYINLAPDYPSLTKPGGGYNWQDKEVPFSINPLALTMDQYKAQSNNVLTRLEMTYSGLLPNLSVKANLGYNTVQVNETGIVPIAAQNPSTSPSGFAQFGDKYLQNWIAEPQLAYTNHIAKGRINLLAGTTWQAMNENNSIISGYGYRYDQLLNSTNGAAGLSTTNYNSEYRYEALFFGRLTYNLYDQYILNLTARRDGSSRFGPGKQFASFGSIGGAWIFSKLKALKSALPALSFGKLRASYGTTGNDQIGDYQYLDIWSSTPYPYLGSSSLYPVRLYNPYYSWEINRKLEAALELGFLSDRILLTSAWYRDRGGNQLIRYGLPLQTGFSGITENFPALVQNAGFEEELTTKNIRQEKFSWTTTINVSIPSNQLVSFPGLASSSYTNLEIGKPLSIVDGYIYTGVNRETGLYSFKDLNNDGQISYPQDYAKNIAHLSPNVYGGVGNSVTLDHWQLDVFATYRNQTGPNYLYYYYNNGYIPGTMYNQPTEVSSRWQQPGQVSGVQKFTAGYNAGAYLAGYDLANSTAAYSSASFVRISTLSLSYSIGPERSWMKKSSLKGLQFYLRAQNLFTFTSYRGSDPETQNAFVLPPLKIVVGGINVKM